MKFVIALGLVLFTVPANAITWEEFWRPLNYGYQPYYRPYYPRVCYETVYQEEYIPPTPWRPGYYRRWRERQVVPCY